MSPPHSLRKLVLLTERAKKLLGDLVALFYAVLQLEGLIKFVADLLAFRDHLLHGSQSVDVLSDRKGHF